MIEQPLLHETSPVLPTQTREQPYIVHPTTKHTATMIYLHGFAGKGERAGSFLLSIKGHENGQTLQELYPGMKFIFPNSTKSRSKISKNKGMVKKWFDLSPGDLDKGAEYQRAGMAESGSYIREVLTDEMKVLEPEKVFLAGTSQGCAAALMILLGLDFPIGGFVGISGWLPFVDDLANAVKVTSTQSMEHGGTDHAIDAVDVVRRCLGLIPVKGGDQAKIAIATPIYLGHGEDDTLVHLERSNRAARTLTKIGMSVIWKTYAGLGHCVEAREIEDIVIFLKGRLGDEVQTEAFVAKD